MGRGLARRNPAASAMNKLQMMLDLSKKLSIGAPFRFKGLAAKVQAFSDEHLFLTVPEIAVPPDQIESAGTEFFARDRVMLDLEKENWELKNEIERLLHDRSYREHRLDQVEMRNRRMREQDMMYRPILGRGFDLGQEPRITDNPRRVVDVPGYFTKQKEVPKYEAPWIDPLSIKKPSQQKD